MFPRAPGYLDSWTGARGWKATVVGFGVGVVRLGLMGRVGHRRWCGRSGYCATIGCEGGHEYGAHREEWSSGDGD